MVTVNLEREKRRQGTKTASGATGIPGAVQAKFEAASGMSFEDVRVHYNSPRPAQLGAYAYTQGSQVYIGPGQERYLEHELGHVIQQKQGIVRADGYINGVPVNRDRQLEQAADLGADQPVQGFWKGLDGVVQMCGKPMQVHHFATNKSRTYTDQMKEITDKYDLSLDGDWNKKLLPHQGRHARQYHEFILGKLREIDSIAEGDKDKFLELYEEMVVRVVSKTPAMMYSDYYKTQ